MKKRKPAIAIGVDLGGTNVRAGRVEGRRAVQVKSQPVRAHGTAEDVFDDLCAVIDAVYTKGVGGIGVGVPSLVDAKDGTIIDTTNIPSWKNVPLRRKLEKKYGVPVRLDNDANCFALGEQRFGSLKAVENFVGLIIGTGLGAGIISRGRLHSGIDCGAGEFGMIPYKDSILEHYASGQFFLKFGRGGAELAASAEAGEDDALQIFAQYGQHLGHAIRIILYALAPEMIVLGGSVAHSLKYFEPAMRESLADFVYPTVLKKCKIRVARLKNVAILGAASLVWD
jgi:glucokinase